MALLTIERFIETKLAEGCQIDTTRLDEGFWLKKRSGHWNRKPRPVQKAELLETHTHDAKIVFREPIPRGKYTLVASTRSMKSRAFPGSMSGITTVV